MREGGSLLYYLAVCPRKVWLTARELNPDEDHPLLELGRFFGARAHPRERLRQVSLPGMVLDWVRQEAGGLLVAEVKQSSRLLEAARLQLLYYLFRLRQWGVEARGEIRIPRERRIVPVELDAAGMAELERALAEVRRLVDAPLPPAPRRIPACRSCAWAEFCWADGEVGAEPEGDAEA